jgi:hypothetical protein
MRQKGREGRLPRVARLAEAHALARCFRAQRTEQRLRLHRVRRLQLRHLPHRAPLLRREALGGPLSLP